MLQPSCQNAGARPSPRGGRTSTGEIIRQIPCLSARDGRAPGRPPFETRFSLKCAVSILNAVLGAFCVLMAQAGMAGPTAAEAAQRPNILIAVADDWSYGHAGAYGCRWVKTPALDRVASQGILFDHAYTPCGKCAPSRASLLTGRNPWQLKAAANHWCYFPTEFKTYPEALAEQGYFVGVTGKGWGPGVATNADGSARLMAGHPFDERRAPAPTSKMSPNDYAANFSEFLQAAPTNAPWCFWFGCREPHRDYEYGSGVAKGHKALADIDRVPACWPDTAAVRNDLLDYAFAVEHFDTHLGRMLAELEQRGLLENTLVVVTSDNGMPFPHDKGNAYQDANHIPLAVLWPRGIARPGRRIADYVSLIDLAPTFFEVAGVAAERTGLAPLTGRSLTEIFRSEHSGRVVPARDHVVIGRERNDVGRPQDAGYPIRGWVQDDWLYLHNDEPSRWPGGNPETGYLDTDGSPTKTEVLKTRFQPEQKHFWTTCYARRPADELYDLHRDPDCVTNLAATISFAPFQARLFAELRQQLDPRALGNGPVFDTYPDASPEHHFYERWQRGETLKAGWVNRTDFQSPGED